MGHKVHPLGFRLGFSKSWSAQWYANPRDYAQILREDLEIRKLVQQQAREGAVARVEIERWSNQVTVTIHTGRPGIIIGRGGQRVEELRRKLEKLTTKQIRLNIQEIHTPELEALLVARSIADQIERRVSYRRAIDQAIQRTMQRGALGIKVHCAGRLGGREIARVQWNRAGRVPLHTMRADIDYGFAEAAITMGRIGVKVWIYKGDIMPERLAPELREARRGAEAVTPAAPAV